MFSIHQRVHPSSWMSSSGFSPNKNRKGGRGIRRVIGEVGVGGEWKIDSGNRLRSCKFCRENCRSWLANGLRNQFPFGVLVLKGGPGRGLRTREVPEGVAITLSAAWLGESLNYPFNHSAIQPFGHPSIPSFSPKSQKEKRETIPARHA